MPNLTLEFQSEHPADRLFDLLRKADNHKRFMPLCRESDIAPDSRGPDDFIVAYRLASRKYGFSRDIRAHFVVDPRHRIVITEPADGLDDRFRAVFKVRFEDGPGGTSRAVADIGYTATGAYRLLPLKTIVARSFQKIMSALEKRASRSLVAG